jgi:capsular polysaccharide biosynthesis protein
MKVINLKFQIQPKNKAKFLDISHIKKTQAYNFYLKYLKKISFIRFFLIKAYQIFAWLIYSLPSFDREKYQLIKLKEFVKNNALSASVLFKSSSVEYISPYVVNIDGIDPDRFIDKKQHFESVFLTQIKDAKVLGSTSLIFKNNEAICHDLYDFDLDYTSEELHYIFNYSTSGISINLKNYNYAHIDEAAIFINALAPNYAHWMTEILPRIAAFCKNSEYKNIPLIINHGLHQNIIHSLRLIASDRNVIFLKKNKGIDIKNLYVVSEAGYTSFEPRMNNIPQSSNGSFNLEALNHVRNFFKSKAASNKKWPKKIFLKRSSGYRNLVNSKEIEALLKKQGFEIFDFKNLSLKDQIGLFSNADIIIGSSGAHFANIIFCNKKTDVYILISDVKETIYAYWPNISSLFDIQIKYIIGHVRVSKSVNVHSDFYVNSKLITESINVK